MAEDREPQSAAPKAPEPTPPVATPSAAPPVAAPLFGTGLGLGMGAPTTVLESLALRPAEERADILHDLHKGAGNRSVSRMLMRVYDDGDMPASDSPGPFSTDQERLDEIRRRLDAGDTLWVPGIWAEMGDRMEAVAGANLDLWSRTMAAAPGMVLSQAPAMRIKRRFKAAVEATVLGFLHANRGFVQKEMEELGVAQDPEAGGPKAAPTPEQDARLRETQLVAELVEQALRAKAALLDVTVGYASVSIFPQPARFHPERKPVLEAPERGVPTWATVKEKYDIVDGFITNAMNHHPAIFALVNQAGGDTPDRDEVTGAAGRSKELAGQSPAEARAGMRRQLSLVAERIDKAVPLVGDDLDYRDFTPIHAQLFAGDADWSKPVPRSIAEKDIAGHELTGLLTSLGIGAVSAAAFILAEFATAGMATFLLVGAGLGAGAAGVGMSWDRYFDLKAAREARATDQALIAKGEVDAALTGAMLDTVFVFLDGVGAAIGPLSKGARAAEAVVEAARHGARATITQGLREALQGAGGRIALEKAVAEIGVTETARAAGMSAEQLAELAGKETELGRRILGVKDLAAEGGKALEELGQKITKLTELKEGVEETVLQAFDAFGYIGTLERVGGKSPWKTLTKKLTDASGSAGPRLMAWRDALLADMQAYIARTSKGRTSAVRTGSQTSHTSDLDVSMFGDDAAQTVAQAREYLAARAGIANKDLGPLLDADMFVDPARIHLQTVTQGLSPETVARIEKEATRFEEQMLFGRRLYEAREAGDAALEEEIRAEARALGVEKIWEGYKPMSADQIAARERDIDIWVKELETATDEAHKQALISKIGRNQAEILAAGEGGYAAHGGVLANVTTRKGDFEKMPEAYRRALGGRVTDGVLFTTERYTAILAEGPHLDRAARAIGAAVEGGAEHVDKLVNAIKDFGKHGERVANLLGADLVGPVGSELRDLAERLRGFMAQAKNGTVAEKAAATESLALLKGEIDTALGQLKAATAKGTSALRKQAELGAAADPRWMTGLQAWDRHSASVSAVGNRLSAATAATLQSAGVATRAAVAGDPGADGAAADDPGDEPQASFDRQNASVAPVAAP